LLLMLPGILIARPQVGAERDRYNILLHSKSLSEQRPALNAILSNPQKYVARIQQSLRDYPNLLQTDSDAANRAVYLSALLSDSSFPPILVKSISAEPVLDECEYACAPVFALTVDASFRGWTIPSNLDSTLTTVHDLRFGVNHMWQMSRKPSAQAERVQGPEAEKYQKELEGKTEEQLIQLAGPDTPSLETRTFAAYRLEYSVASSKNRTELYLLAFNSFEDASGEYLSAVCQGIYRAENAKAQGK
jgi:hypothetical protein